MKPLVALLRCCFCIHFELHFSPKPKCEPAIDISAVIKTFNRNVASDLKKIDVIFISDKIINIVAYGPVAKQ
jgi:hypothetical protein